MNETPTFRDPRFAVTLLVILIASAMAYFAMPGRQPPLNGDQWVGAVTWTITAYMLGKAAGVFASGYAAKSVAIAQAVKS